MKKAVRKKNNKYTCLLRTHSTTVVLKVWQLGLKAQVLRGHGTWLVKS